MRYWTIDDIEQSEFERVMRTFNLLLSKIFFKKPDDYSLLRSMLQDLMPTIVPCLNEPDPGNPIPLFGNVVRVVAGENSFVAFLANEFLYIQFLEGQITHVDTSWIIGITSWDPDEPYVGNYGELKTLDGQYFRKFGTGYFFIRYGPDGQPYSRNYWDPVVLSPFGSSEYHFSFSRGIEHNLSIVPYLVKKEYQEKILKKIQELLQEHHKRIIKLLGEKEVDKYFNLKQFGYSSFLYRLFG